MTQRTECFTFHCRDCRIPIFLPCDAYAKLSEDQWDQSSDEQPVILVCEICKHANIYSPLLSSRYHDPTDTRGAHFPGGEAERLLSVRCTEQTCQFRLPFVITGIDGMTTERKEEYTMSWIGEDLKCPKGHPIAWPFGKKKE